MKAKHEWKVIDQEGNILDGFPGEQGEFIDPVMIYAQIPIERKRFYELTEECREYKTNIYELLESAINIKPEDDINLFN